LGDTGGAVGCVADAVGLAAGVVGDAGAVGAAGVVGGAGVVVVVVGEVAEGCSGDGAGAGWLTLGAGVACDGCVGAAGAGWTAGAEAAPLGDAEGVLDGAGVGEVDVVIGASGFAACLGTVRCGAVAWCGAVGVRRNPAACGASVSCPA
jgi:hypothetical protein